MALPGVSNTRWPNLNATLAKPSRNFWCNSFLSLTNEMYLLDLCNKCMSLELGYYEVFNLLLYLVEPRERRVMKRSMMGLEEARPRKRIGYNI